MLTKSIKYYIVDLNLWNLWRKIMGEIQFDILLPVAIKDAGNLDLCLDKVYTNLNPRKIIIVADKKVKNHVRENKYIEFCNEDDLVENLTLNTIKRLMKIITGEDNRSGWYFQQFLKMAYAIKSKTKYYLVWDSDTIPLNHIYFFKNIINGYGGREGNGKCLFTMKGEHHVPYFKTINTLFDGIVFKLTNKSFIAEHMMIDRDIMIEIIEKIEKNKKVNGNKFYEKILYAIDRNEITGSGFSEFETYGNYVLKYYPERYCLRELRTLREGSNFINKADINNNILNWIAKSYDTVSFEDHGTNETMKKLKLLFRWVIKTRIISFRYYQMIVILLERLIKRLIKKNST
jgi:hypothetical protein